MHQIPSRRCEDAAKQELEKLSPGLLDKIFSSRFERKKQEELTKVKTAREQDQRENDEATEAFEEELADWLDDQRIAEGVLRHDGNVMIDALLDFGELPDEFAPGTTLEVECDDDNPTHMIATITIGDACFPKEDHRLTKINKLSTRPMPKRKLLEVQFDYTCGSALRVVREIFALLPSMEHAIVTVFHDFDNEAGEPARPVLSMSSSRANIEGVDFDSSDPAGLIEQFEHRLKFLKTRGFASIIPLHRADIE